jgi:hypothetical protein
MCFAIPVKIVQVQKLQRQIEEIYDWFEKSLVQPDIQTTCGIIFECNRYRQKSKIIALACPTR